MHRQFLFVLLAFALAGCQRKPLPEQKQPPGAELAEVLARSAQAFRQTDQGAMSAEGPSHRVTVDRKGGFLFELRKREATKEPAPSLAFARPSIRRGSFTLDASEEQARGKDERVVELRRGTITEELTNGEQGIEQAWRFAAEPEGKGGLVIEIGVSGLPFAGAGEAGLDFRDPETGALVRYGVARWIDATGTDRVLPLPSFEGGRIVLRVPEDVLEASAFPAVLDPLVSAPLELADAEIAAASSGTFESGDVAFDGHRFMAVFAIGGHVVARRIEPTGEALDGTGIDLGAGKNPVIAFDGAHYVIAFGRQRYPDLHEIRIARVTPEGVALDPDGRAIATAAESVRSAIASNGSVSLVVFEDRAGWAVRIDSSGAPLDPVPLELPAFGGPLSVASDGTDFLVTWARDGSILGRKISAAGAQPAADIAIAPSSRASNPAVAYGANAYLVVFEASGNTTATDLLAARVGRSGAVLDASPIPVARQLANEKLAALAFDGANFAVGYATQEPSAWSGDFRVSRLDPAGHLVGTSSILSEDVGEPAFDRVAFGADELLVLMSGSRIGLQAKRLARDGTPIDTQPIAVAARAHPQTDAAVAANDGNQFLVAWIDHDVSSVLATRVTSDGAPVDRPAIRIPGAATSIPSSFGPSVLVGAMGPDFVTIHQSYDQGLQLWELRATRLVAGTVAGQSLIATSDRSFMAEAVCMAHQCLVTWQDPPRGRNLFALLDSDLATTHSGEIQPARALATDGQSYVFGFQEARGADTIRRVARMDANGQVLDPDGVELPGSVTHQIEAIAFDGSHFVVLSNGGYSVYLQRFAPDLAVIDPSPVLLAPAFAWPCVISYDGRTLLAGWNGLNAPARFELARVTTDLVSLDPGGFGIPSVPPSANACFAGLASLPSGRSLLVWTPQLGDGYWSSQVRARLITSVANQSLGSSCWGGDECASGTCEDGVCCDRTCGGSDPSDCQACSIAAGASADGVCGVIGQGHVCREVSASCDVPEICDGVSPLCPADAFEPAGALCRRAAGPCDVSESCDGASARCPVDRVARSGTVCRPARGPCDYEDQCDGHDSACPDQHRTDICRPGTGPCDPPERCTAESDDCPPDLLVPAGTPCGEPAYGRCEASATCTGSDGQCPAKEVFPDGHACDDENACTTGDVCSEKRCAGQPVVCPEKQCQQGFCDRSTDGGCSYQPANDYTPCGDGGLCHDGTCGLPDSGFGDQPTLLDAGADSGLDAGIEDAGQAHVLGEAVADEGDLARCSTPAPTPAWTRESRTRALGSLMPGHTIAMPIPPRKPTPPRPAADATRHRKHRGPPG